MTTQPAPDKLQQRAHREALRYVQNAMALLVKAGLNREWYVDQKYVRLAGHALYHALLIALDELYRLAGLPPLPKPWRKSIEYYRYHADQLDEALAGKRKNDHRLRRDIDAAYKYSHLLLGYDGFCNKHDAKIALHYINRVIRRIAPRAPRVHKVDHPRAFQPLRRALRAAAGA